MGVYDTNVDGCMSGLVVLRVLVSWCVGVALGLFKILILTLQNQIFYTVSTIRVRFSMPTTTPAILAMTSVLNM